MNPEDANKINANGKAFNGCTKCIIIPIAVFVVGALIAWLA